MLIVLLTGGSGMSVRREQRRLEREVTEAGATGRATTTPAGRPSRRRLYGGYREPATEREPTQS